jgi:hypothetical protein
MRVPTQARHGTENERACEKVQEKTMGEKKTAEKKIQTN